MSCNIWSFTGKVLGFRETRGKEKDGSPASWGKMWIRIQLDPISLPYLENMIPDNVLFLHIFTDYGNSQKARTTSALLGSMSEGSHILVKGARIDKIRRGVRKDSGEFDEIEEIGIRATPSKILVSKERLPSLNLGMVEGKITRQGGNTIIVEEPYLVPGEKKEWRHRDIPLVLSKEPDGDIVGKHIVTAARLSGKTQSGDSKICGFVTEDIAIV